MIGPSYPTYSCVVCEKIEVIEKLLKQISRQLTRKSIIVILDYIGLINRIAN